MKIKSLNFQMIESNKELSMVALCFFKLLNSKLHRVVGLPEVGDKVTELDQVLNTLCLRKKDGIWYFRFTDQEAEMQIMEIMLEMDIPHLVCEPDETWCN